MTVPETAIAAVRRYCETCVPREVRDQIRVEHVVRGNSITIVECRPPWREEAGPDWTKLPYAQLRFDPESKLWSLYWQRANGRWWLFDEQPATADVKELLNTIEENPYGVFLG